MAFTREDARACARAAWGVHGRTYVWPDRAMSPSRRYRVYHDRSMGRLSGSGATWREACENAGILPVAGEASIDGLGRESGGINHGWNANAPTPAPTDASEGR